MDPVDGRAKVLLALLHDADACERALELMVTDLDQSAVFGRVAMLGAVLDDMAAFDVYVKLRKPRQEPQSKQEMIDEH